jgi:anthranilate phosphoribosyltransferase
MPLDAIRKVVTGQHLTREEAAAAAAALMEGEASPSQVAALLIALRMKGETVEEIVGFAQAMRARVVPVHPQRTGLLDTCGTGGSPFRVFNVSTASAFVLAAAGVPVAKHGNRAVTGVCGSADVLEALGVNVHLSPEAIARCIDEVGLGFLFAQAHHPAMKHVGPTRREIAVRTLFNLIGPLTNPAGATRQTLGVYDAVLCPMVAAALRELGSERAIVLHGEIGMGEVATIGDTYVSELHDDEITHYRLTPADFGLTGPEPNPDFLAPAATPQENADFVREVLSGKASTPAARARRDLVAVNAAASLRVCGLEEDWKAATDRAFALLESGKALEIAEKLAALTHSLA